MPFTLTITNRYLIINTNSKYFGEILELDPLKDQKPYLVSAKRIDGTWLHFKPEEVKFESTVKRVTIRTHQGVKYELIGMTVDMSKFDKRKTNEGWYALKRSNLFESLDDDNNTYWMDRFYSKLKDYPFPNLQKMFQSYDSVEEMCVKNGFEGISVHPNNSKAGLEKYGVTKSELDVLQCDYYTIYISADQFIMK